MRASSDEDIKGLRDSDQLQLALQQVLAGYGGEIMRFLMARTADAQLASETFAVFSEDMCRGLPGFEFRSSLRTWLYTLAHHALSRTRRVQGRERARRESFSEVNARTPIVAQQRTDTPIYMKTESKQVLRSLRESLSEEDQTLLDLRTTRRFSWKDIARIHLGAHPEMDQAMIDKEAARLRKRYQLLVERLRELANEGGLLDRTSES